MLLLKIEHVSILVLAPAVQDAFLHELQFAVILRLCQDQVVVFLSRLSISHINLFDQALRLNLVQVILVTRVPKLFPERLDRLALAKSVPASRLVVAIFSL